MEQLNYHEIVEKLAEIDQRLRQMDLNQHHRIRIHLRHLTELAEATDRGTLAQITNNLTGGQRREILWSFVESIKFVDAVDALQKQSCDIPKAVLMKEIKGPPDACLEDDKSNQGRNAMFELWVAGRVAFAGLEPRLGGEPDESFEFENRRMLVPCKRVLSESAVAKRIGEAALQLDRDLALSADPKDCGVIAISISRLINPRNKMLTVATDTDLQSALSREIDKVIERHAQVCRGVKHPKTGGHPLGGLCHAQAPLFPCVPPCGGRNSNRLVDQKRNSTGSCVERQAGSDHRLLVIEKVIHSVRRAILHSVAKTDL